MDIRKKKASAIIGLAIFIVLALCIALTIPMSVSTVAKFVEPTETAQAATAPAGTVSVVNLALTGAERNNFQNALKGAQNEYVYFGSANTTTPFKWRVLSAKDNKYGNDSILLFTDTSFGACLPYNNDNYYNPNYAFWSVSMIRAFLNGGKYLANKTNNTAIPTLTSSIAQNSSKLYTTFNDNERRSVLLSKQYETLSFGILESSTPKLATNDIVAATKTTGKFTSSNVSAMNTVADTMGTIEVTSDNNGVHELTQDYLFLLDYYDVNNVDYGFYDLVSGKPVTYANKVNASWTADQPGFPAREDNDTPTSEYLKYSNNSSYWWLRNGGRKGDNAYFALAYVGFIGVPGSPFDQNLARAAFNFDPESVVYATAANVASIGNTFTSVTAQSAAGKPAYKVYTKSSGYVNYNSNLSTAPTITVDSGSVTVSKSGLTGKAIFLLSDRKDGSVKYQATANLDASGVATATLPNGVDASKYAINVLFADSLRGGYFAENITGSLTYSKIEIPSNATLTYNGEARTIKDLSNQSWYYDAIYEDTNIITSSLNATHKGDYSVSLTLLPNKYVEWEDSTTGKKSITVSIVPKEIGIDWSQDEKNIWSAAPVADDICEADKASIATLIDTRYQNKDGTPAYNQVNTKPKNAGDYTATAELKNADYAFKSSETNPQEFNLPVLMIAPLKNGDADKGEDDNFDPSHIQEYSGRDRIFFIKDYSNYRWYGEVKDAAVEISVPDRFKDIIDLTGGTITVKDKGKAGTYALLLTLTDPINSQWNDKTKLDADKNTPREVEFTISQKTLNAKVDGLNNGTLTVNIDEESAMITLEMISHPLVSDSISVDVYATRNGTTNEFLLASDILIKASDRDDNIYEYDITLDIMKLPATPGEYTLTFVIDKGDDQTNQADNASYILQLQDEDGQDIDGVNLVMTDAVDENNVVWRLKDERGSRIITVRTPVDTLTTDYPTTKAYPAFGIGKTYTFTVDVPTGYSVEPITDPSIGCADGYKDATQSNANKDGEFYTTSVKIRYPDGNVKDYSITWRIDKAKFDLSKVKWVDNGELEYTGTRISPTVEGLPAGLEIDDIICTPAITVGPHGTAQIQFKIADEYDGNFVLPEEYEDGSYDGEFDWTISWKIVPVKIKPGWKREDAMDKNDIPFKVMALSDQRVADKVDYEYYETDSEGNIINDKPFKIEDIEVSATVPKYYKAKAVLQSLYAGNYEFRDEADALSIMFQVGGSAVEVIVTLEENSYVYNGKTVELKWASGTPVASLNFTYYEGEVFGNKIDGVPKEAGKYWVEIAPKNDAIGLGGDTRFQFEITKNVISEEWNTATAKPPVLRNLTKLQLNEGIAYEYYDADDHKIEFKDLSNGGTFKIRAVVKDNKNFIFEGGGVETQLIEFTITAGEDLKDPSDIGNPNYNFDDDDPPSGTPSGNIPGSNEGGNGGGTIDLGNVGEVIKQWWQVIASAVSIVLIAAFLGKTVGYESKRKKFNKKADKLNSGSMYAAAATGLFGWAMSSWTVIACVLMGLAVASFVIMMIAKSRVGKAQEEYEEAFAEQQQKKEENLRMMLMGMGNGGMGQGIQQGYAYAQPAFGVDEMRGLITETVSALLPGAQQLLPQQASTNDELVNKLIEQNEMLMQQLAEQKSSEKIIEREVAASGINEDALKDIIDKNDENIKKIMQQNDERMSQMMKTQEALIAKLLEKDNTQQVQIIEKEVPVEKVVEKIVEVPVEKIVEKQVKVEVPVEKIVEKEIIKEVKVAAPAKPKKEIAPRLTLDEAYALLSKQQKKYFDGLREYALSKPNSKEKKSTYAITIGQSTVNPLLKLTIKKDMTVALFKMEDEYLKDIKRDASGDGTKIKVKETEVIISDAQACKAAKNMIDLREDQIERYNDLLKEQRALKRK